MNNENLSTPLIEAVKKNDIDEVRRLIEAGADVNESETIEYNLSYEPDEAEKQTPLMYAVQNNNKEMVEFLIKNGADVNKKGIIKEPETVSVYECGEVDALLIATANDNIEIAELLIESGAWLSEEYEYVTYFWTLLMIASYCNSTKVAQLLIDNGASVLEGDGNEYQTLVCAADANAKEVAELLIKNDKNHELDYEQALLYAVDTNSCEVAELILSYEKEISSKWLDGLLLNLPCVRMIEILLKYGADVNATNDQGNSALKIASHRNLTDVVELLLKHGATPLTIE